MGTQRAKEDDNRRNAEEVGRANRRTDRGDGMRGTLKHRRSAKEMKRDREDHFADLAEHEPTENAKKWMQRGAYSVEDCLRKWGVDTKGSVASGQENTEKV